MATKEGVNASIGLGLAIIGAVCGTAMSSLVTESGAIRLVALCIGAAIPPFVSTIGQWRPVRATLAVLITVVALVVTYSGSVGVTVTTGDVIVPVPPGLHVPSKTTTTSPPTATTSGGDDRVLEAAPTKLTCKPLCDSKVTIKSAGPCQYRGARRPGEGEVHPYRGMRREDGRPR
jgi:hypothetical protein